jgi:hypothetical protein
MPVIAAMKGSTNRRIVVQAGLGIKQDPISKITNTKKGQWGSSLNDRAPA